jgi:hypothetical protein
MLIATFNNFSGKTFSLCLTSGMKIWRDIKR